MSKTEKPQLSFAACLSSDKMDWATPQALFDKLNAEFHFTVDVCASAWNAKMPRYWSVEQDALSLSLGPVRSGL